MAQDIQRSLTMAAEDVRNIMELLADVGEDDDQELVADTIEGETDAVELMQKAVDEMDECDLLLAGIAERITSLRGREHKLKLRKERLRSAIEQLLAIAELKSIRLPSCTLSLRKVGPKAIVTEEADVPAWFFEEKIVMKLNKGALLDHLKKGGEVAGAELSNGGVALTVRRS